MHKINYSIFEPKFQIFSLAWIFVPPVWMKFLRDTSNGPKFVFFLIFFLGLIFLVNPKKSIKCWILKRDTICNAIDRNLHLIMVWTYVISVICSEVKKTHTLLQQQPPKLEQACATSIRGQAVVFEVTARSCSCAIRSLIMPPCSL